MKRLGGSSGQREPTVAALAGTTLGLINVPGLPLGPKQRCFDTPGVPHAHQLTALLNPEEVRLVSSKGFPYVSIMRTFRVCPIYISSRHC